MLLLLRGASASPNPPDRTRRWSISSTRPSCASSSARTIRTRMTAMTTIEHPWEGLVSGGIDARRVDSAGRWDFFWWVSERGEPALILRLAAGAEEIMPLPKMRSLDLRYRDIPGTRALVIVLREPEQRELFATLCHDVVKAGEAASTARDALE